MKLSRRAFVTTLSAISALPTMRGFARETSEIPALETGDIRVISISPDGETFLGRDRDDILSFMSADSLAPISQTEPTTAFSLIDELSVSWSPDGKMVALSLRAWELMSDSDIFLVNVADGAVINATRGEGEIGMEPLLNPSPGTTVDVFPYWKDETTVLFARHQKIEDVWQCILCELTTKTSNITEIVSLHDHDIQFVSGQFHKVSDRELVVWVTLGTGLPGLALINLDGDVSLVDTGEIIPMGTLSASDTNVLLLNPRGGDVWQIPLEGDDSWINMDDLFQVSEEEYFMVLPTYAPDTDSIAAVVGPDARVMILQDGEVNEQGTLGNLPDTPLMQIIWANDRLLVTSRSSSWMIDITG